MEAVAAWNVTDALGGSQLSQMHSISEMRESYESVQVVRVHEISTVPMATGRMRSLVTQYSAMRDVYTTELAIIFHGVDEEEETDLPPPEQTFITMEPLRRDHFIKKFHIQQKWSLMTRD